jgi:hypothetical protein
MGHCEAPPPLHCLLSCRCLDKAAIKSEAGPLVTLTEVVLWLLVCRCLDKAAIKSEAGPLVTLTEVEESKAFFGILPLFLCICIYQMTYVSHTGCCMGCEM